MDLLWKIILISNELKNDSSWEDFLDYCINDFVQTPSGCLDLGYYRSPGGSVEDALPSDCCIQRKPSDCHDNGRGFLR